MSAAKVRAALEFYANSTNYQAWSGERITGVDEDNRGNLAREALAALRPEPASCGPGLNCPRCKRPTESFADGGYVCNTEGCALENCELTAHAIAALEGEKPAERSTLASYLTLEVKVVGHDDDSVRDAMDPIWHALSDEDRAYLDSRGTMDEPAADITSLPCLLDPLPCTSCGAEWTAGATGWLIKGWTVNFGTGRTQVAKIGEKLCPKCVGEPAEPTCFERHMDARRLDEGPAPCALSPETESAPEGYWDFIEKLREDLGGEKGVREFLASAEPAVCATCGGKKEVPLEYFSPVTSTMPCPDCAPTGDASRRLRLVWGNNERAGKQHMEWHAPCGCAYHPEPTPHVHQCEAHAAPIVDWEALASELEGVAEKRDSLHISPSDLHRWAAGVRTLAAKSEQYRGAMNDATVCAEELRVEVERLKTLSEGRLKECERYAATIKDVFSYDHLNRVIELEKELAALKAAPALTEEEVIDLGAVEAIIENVMCSSPPSATDGMVAICDRLRAIAKRLGGA